MNDRNQNQHWRDSDDSRYDRDDSREMYRRGGMSSYGRDQNYDRDHDRDRNRGSGNYGSRSEFGHPGYGNETYRTQGNEGRGYGMQSPYGSGRDRFEEDRGWNNENRSGRNQSFREYDEGSRRGNWGSERGRNAQDSRGEREYGMDRGYDYQRETGRPRHWDADDRGSSRGWSGQGMNGPDNGRQAGWYDQDQQYRRPDRSFRDDEDERYGSGRRDRGDDRSGRDYQ